MNWKAILAAVALLTPAQAEASSCIWFKATKVQLETPAGVLEYRKAKTVVVVGLAPRPQPPCGWVIVARWFNPAAYARDVCEPGGRSQRYRATVQEVLKGTSPSSFDAVFDGPHPISSDWLFRHRPEVMWTRPTVWQRGRELEDRENDAPGHSAFAYLHRGRIGDRTVAIKSDSCGGWVAPMITTYGGRMSYLVFLDSEGRITHWEPVIRNHADFLLARLRRLKAGEADVRDEISARDFFKSLKIVSRYRVEECTDGSSKLRPPSGERERPIETLAHDAFVTDQFDTGCRPGQQFLVIGAGLPPGGYFEERAWPSVQLLPVAGDTVRTSDIVTQFKIVGPPTLSVSEVLTWTD
ncbi:MAG: hypothetical protein ACOY4K_13535 [Pseudomonadota bacterium]